MKNEERRKCMNSTLNLIPNETNEWYPPMTLQLHLFPRFPFQTYGLLCLFYSPSMTLRSQLVRYYI